MSGEHPVSDETPAPAKPRVEWLHSLPGRVTYYLCYIGSAASLARLIHHFRLALGAGRPEEQARANVSVAALTGAVWTLALFACVLLLAFYAYEDLRWKGRVVRRNRFFEWLLRHSPPSP